MAIDFNKVPRYIRHEIEHEGRQIERGGKRRSVQRVQEWLNFHKCNVAIDGDYGPATQMSVADFQRKNRLAVTGAVDAKTWDTLVAPLRTALRPPKNTGHLSAAQTVRQVAEQHLAQHPLEIGAPNQGPWVRLYCQGNDGPEWAWCAGFVSLVMSQAYFFLEKHPPIKGSVSCDTLAAQAQAAGLFVPGSKIASGKVAWSSLGGCCIFLRRRTDTDWHHAGFALDATGSGEETVFTTIEGNTNALGSREGFEACQRKRSIGQSSYDFVTFV